MANRIGRYMQQEGIKFLLETVTESGEKLEDGKLKISYKNKAGQSGSDVFDSVLVATGRYPDTQTLNCEGFALIRRLHQFGQIGQDHRERRREHERGQYFRHWRRGRGQIGADPSRH